MISGAMFFLGLVILVIFFTLLGTLLWSKKGLGKKWVAVGDGDVTLAFSNDGKTWTGVDGLFGDNEIGSASSVHRTGDRWVVVGRDGDDEGANIWWSDDAENWNLAVNNDDEDDVFWGVDNGDTGTVVTNARNTWVVGGETDGPVNLYWSDDGKTWNEEEDGIFAGSSVNVIKYLGGLWLCGGNADSENQSIYWSNDGKSWTAATNAEGGRIFKDAGAASDFDYHDGLWVVGGRSPGEEKHLWWSEDGKEWNAIKTSIFGTTGFVNKVEYNRGKWVAVGDGNDTSAIGYSTDGKNWTADTSIGTSEDDFNTVAYSDGFWIAGGSDVDGTAQIYRSEDAMTWTKADFEITLANSESFAVDGKMVVTGVIVGDGPESLWYSEDSGETWQEPDENPFGSSSQVYQVIYM